MPSNPAPIKGVIHRAMALRDVLFEKMSFSDWNLNVRLRVQGAWSLHHGLADAKLAFFVMLASCAGMVETAGQAAYAVSNTFLDALGSYRKNLGLPACAIDIGYVADAGYIFENKEREAEISVSTHDRLTEDELLTLVKAAITEELSGNNEQQTLTGFKLWPDRPLPTWASDPKFLHVVANVQSGATAGAEDDGSAAVQHRIKQADLTGTSRRAGMRSSDPKDFQSSNDHDGRCGQEKACGGVRSRLLGCRRAAKLEYNGPGGPSAPYGTHEQPIY